MALQLARTPEPLALLFVVAQPPLAQQTAYGYTRQPDESWSLNSTGSLAAAIAQRVLLSYVLRLEDRDQLSRRYCLSIKQIQDIVNGRAHRHFTAPLREHLQALGIGSPGMHRERRSEREAQIRRAYGRLAALATGMLRDWSERTYSARMREEVARDLWLLSGAWREDEP